MKHCVTQGLKINSKKLMSQRAMKYLNDNRIVYRKYSEDQPTQEYEWGWYYADGTHGYYSLFNSDAKINTLRSLKWHLLTLWWLNPDMSLDKFKQLSEVICYKPNNFVTFNIPEELLNKVVQDVFMQDLERPPKNRRRKVIFDVNCYLTAEEKLKITGRLVGRKKIVHKDDVYEAMLHINDTGDKITISKLAKHLKCSDRTIYRTMGNELKKEKELLNNDL